MNTSRHLYRNRPRLSLFAFRMELLIKGLTTTLTDQHQTIAQGLLKRHTIGRPIWLQMIANTQPGELPYVQPLVWDELARHLLKPPTQNPITWELLLDHTQENSDGKDL